MSNFPSNMRRLLSGKEAAEYLGITYKRLWELVQSGVIHQVKLVKNARPKYDIRELDTLIEENKSLTPAAQVLKKISTN